MSPGPRPTSVLSGIVIHPPFGHNRHGPKIWGMGGGAPYGGAGSPSNMMWPRPRPTSVPRGILIHPTVWPQYTNVADRQDKRINSTDNGSIAQGEPFYKRSPKN